VELDINGVWGPSNRLETAIVVEASPDTVVRLQDENGEVDSPDFPAPLVFTVKDSQVRGAVSTYRIWISMPTIPTDLFIKFPKLEVQGNTVELRNLVLRSERQVVGAPLVCQ